MPTAEELFSSVLPEHTHPVVDADTYFIIDPVSRLITNASGTTNVLMQYDHNSERFTFELPRYVEGHDMLLCNVIKVHFNNLNGEGWGENINVYDIDDLKLDPKNPDNVICTWLISRAATQFAGTLNFIVQYACVVDGEEVYEWHSDIYSDVLIKTGRDNGDTVITPHVDLLEQWRTNLFGEKDSLIADIQAESQAQQDEIAAKAAIALASIPDDYITTHNMADRALRTKSDAIIVTESGEDILLDDSSDCNILGFNLYGRTTQVKTTGKNLLNLPQYINKLTSGYNYDLFTGLSGSSASVSAEFIDQLPVLEPGTYYFHAEISGTTNTEIKLFIIADDGTTSIDKVLVNRPGAFTINETTRLSVRVGTSNAVVIRNIQIEIGDQYTGYEPYSNGLASPTPEYPQPLLSIEEPSISIYGRNLLDIKGLPLGSNTSLDISDDGYTIVATGGGSKSYASSSMDLDLDTLKGRTIIFAMDSLKNTISSAGGCQITATTPNGNVYFAITGSIPSKTVIIPDDTTKLSIGIYSNNTNAALGEDNTVTVKGLGIYLVDGGWEAPKTYQEISLPYTLRGIPVTTGGNYTDNNGQQWVCDEIDFERGKLIQRTKYVLLSDYANNFTKSSNTLYSSTILRFDLASTLGCPKKDLVLCDQLPFKFAHDSDTQSAVRNSECVSSHSMYDAISIFISSSRLSTPDLDGFKQWLSSTQAHLLCPTTDIIETDLTETEIAAFLSLHTNATNTTILNDQNAAMSVKYNADIKRYIYKNVNTLRKFDLTLLAANWVEHNNGIYYSQVVDLDVRDDIKIDLHPTAQQLISLIQDGMSMFVANENGVVTIYSIGGVPDVDLTIRATETVVYYV